jgi:hypothetical protein
VQFSYSPSGSALEEKFSAWNCWSSIYGWFMMVWLRLNSIF